MHNVPSGAHIAKPTDGFNARPTAWFVALLIIVHQMALTIIHYVVAPLAGLPLDSATTLASTITLSAVTIFLLAAFDLRRPGRSHAILLNWPPFTAGTAGAIALGLTVAQIPLLILFLKGATIWQTGHSTHLTIGGALAVTPSLFAEFSLILATAIIAPMVEELIYRGYLLGTMLGRIPTAVAAIISATTFVTLHFEAANLIASFCLGLGASVCAIRTRSILPGVIVHIVSNGFGLWYGSLT